MIRSAVSVVAAVFVLTLASGVGAQSDVSLELALVMSVTSAPLFEPDGTSVADAGARLGPLADALAQLADPQLRTIPIAFAPSPVFCDELALSPGSAAARLRTTMHQLAGQGTVLSAPYAEVRLPHLNSAATVHYQITEGRRTLRACTGVRPVGVLAAPDLALDRDVLEALTTTAITTTLAPEDRVAPSSVRSRNVVLVPTAVLRGTEAPNDVIYRFRNHRAGAAIMQPGPASATFIRALANDPRVRLRTITELIGDPPVRSISFPESSDPPGAYRSRIERAAKAVAGLRSYTAPNNRLVGVLRAAFARARGSAEWDENWATGSARAEAIVETVDGQRRLVGTEDGSVTFTSRRGSVPVTVRNRAPFPVRVRVALTSPKLSFPDGPSRIATVAPPGDTIVFVALARSTGSFPVEVRLTSPTGSIHFDTGEIAVRSVAANLPALILTGGGAVFLVAWYLRSLQRRHRQREGRMP